jgi:hypothetical protein
MHSNKPNSPQETSGNGKKPWTRPVASSVEAAGAEARNFSGTNNDGTFVCSS